MSTLSNLIKFGGKSTTKQREYKMNIITSMTLDEMLVVIKEFISKDPKVLYVDENGKSSFRSPSRVDMVTSLFEDVAIDEILRVSPRIAEKFGEKEKLN